MVESREENNFVNLCPAFTQIGRGQRAFLVSASSQWPLAQNNHYATVAHFGVAYSATLHIKKSLDTSASLWKEHQDFIGRGQGNRSRFLTVRC